MRTETIDYRDGFLCIRYSEPAFHEPLQITHYWPVRKCPKDEVIHLIGQQAHAGNPGDYSVHTPNVPGRAWTSLRLADGGSTRPIETTTEPIPPPKVRKGIETRYYQGQWQKYLKSQGWVSA